MSFKLQIKNYQAIRLAELNFEPGLNVIVGSSNNGKSAIIRSLITSLFNLPKDSHITLGENRAVVAVDYNGHKVVWQRDTHNTTKTMYKVDNQLYAKVGKAPLKEVEDALGIKEIELEYGKERLNFQVQMSYPFLLDKTGSQLFKFLSQSAEEENLSQVLTQMRKDFKDIQATNNETKASMDTLKRTATKEYEYLKKLTPYKSGCEILLSKASEFENIAKDNEDLEQVHKGYESIVDINDKLSGIHLTDLTSIKNLLDVTVDLDKMINDLKNVIGQHESVSRDLDCINSHMFELPPDTTGYLSDLQNLYEECSRLESSCKEYKDAIALKERQEQVIGKCVSDLNSIIVSIDSTNSLVSELQTLVDEIKVLKGSCNEYEEGISGIDGQLSTISTELSTFDVCPFCGSSLKGE